MPSLKKSKAQTAKPPASREDSVVVPTARRQAKYRQRIGQLFTELERLATNPACADPEIRRQLEALRTRLRALEAQVSESTEAPAAPAAQGQTLPPTQIPPLPTRPLLFDPDQIGYIYSQDQLQEIRHASLPEEAPPVIAVPLVARGLPIGTVQLAPPAERPLSTDETDLVSAVAQQASLQIESLRLLSETERARAEAVSASRRFMHESWASYLDAIHQHERIGYAYDQVAVAPYLEEPESEAVIEESVQVLEEQVGRLVLKPDPVRPFADDDKEMITAVAGQIAQQVENLRLLADASRARAEADEVIKRMTREGWESFEIQKEDDATLSFAYDTNRVTAFKDQIPEKVALKIPLRVRGETIGQLAVTGREHITPEAADLAEAIARQMSTHLETLRLNEELQRRAAELLELDRLKSGFLANMSHELRTPLNSILGFADVVLEGLDGPLTPNMSSDIMLIQKNGQHLLHLINDVLDMAKIEAGRMNLSPEKVKVYDIIEEVTSITSTLASEKHLALFIETDSDQTVEIFADRTRLRQVMINLVNNAIKFTEKGRIAIRLVRKDEEHVLITVNDTGIGIPPDKLEVIFQEFTQVDTSATRKAGGTGLGLPISRRLVEMHGGLLWAESSGVSGEGSTFFVELPMTAKITDVVVQKEK
jgi:signal transduction histidine kinase